MEEKRKQRYWRAILTVAVLILLVVAAIAVKLFPDRKPEIEQTTESVQTEKSDAVADGIPPSVIFDEATQRYVFNAKVLECDAFKRCRLQYYNDMELDPDKKYRMDYQIIWAIFAYQPMVQQMTAEQMEMLYDITYEKYNAMIELDNYKDLADLPYQIFDAALKASPLEKKPDLRMPEGYVLPEYL